MEFRDDSPIGSADMSKIEPIKKEWTEVGKPSKGSANTVRIAIQQAVTPIFDRDVGARMATVRMKMLMSQAELGKLLGVSQRVICDLESGHIAVSRKPFTLARFQAIFGDHSTYILRGMNAEKYSVGEIRQRYWKRRLKRKD